MLLSLFSSATFQYGGRIIFDCNFDIRDLILAPHVPKFFRDIYCPSGKGYILRTLPQLMTTSMKLFGTTVL